MHAISIPHYEAVYNQAAYYIHPNGGILSVSGIDRSDFLQRQTTNDLRLLQSGLTLTTVLTSPTGRILDVLCLIDNDDEIHGVTLPGRVEFTAPLLQSKIFFMDKVTVEDISDLRIQLDLIGPRLGETLQKFGVEQLPKANQLLNIEIGMHKGLIIRLMPTLALGYRMIMPVKSSDDLFSYLEKAGVCQLNFAEYNLIRIEAGLPGSERELIDEYTPLEVGLIDAISNDKGCYTGQEVIARQITYDKVSRQLCGLRLKAQVNLGDRIWKQEKNVGVITSFVFSPDFGPIALGVIRKAFTQPKTILRIGGNWQEGVPGEVIILPFEKINP
jgi:folate-binding protein YgfZ